MGPFLYEIQRDVAGRPIAITREGWKPLHIPPVANDVYIQEVVKVLNEAVWENWRKNAQ